MEKEKLKELIINHKEGFLLRTGLIRREVQRKAEKLLKSKEIILITGVRRGGKSSLMRLICDDLISKFNIPKSNILYLNFEDERFIDFTVKDFDILYETFLELENPEGKSYFFLDEIQNIKGWERWVNRLYEFENIKFFITGSNATILSSEISTALTGRNRQIITWPFSFSEFLTLRGISLSDNELYLKEKRIILKRLFKEYFKFGGFPEVLKLKDTTLLEQYFKDIIYRDLIARYSIRNIKELKEVCLYLASNPATICSYENLKNLIKAKNINTIKNYLEILENVFLFFRVPFFDYSIKKQIYNPGKFYIVDVGLSQTLGFNFSKNIGHIYENLVFLELKRMGKEVYYWKSKKAREVDFVIKRGTEIEEVIQVCFSLSNEETKEREIEGLLEAKKEFNPNRFVIITDDEEREEKIDKLKIEIIPLWKWCFKQGLRNEPY